MNNLSFETTQGCIGVLNTFYKKISGSIKIFLISFLFTGAFVHNAFAQSACKQMVTPGFVSCAGEVIIYTANVNHAGNVSWTIGPNSSGAFFTANSLTTISGTVSLGLIQWKLTLALMSVLSLLL